LLELLECNAEESDEGTVVIKIPNPINPKTLEIYLCCTDTNDYPYATGLLWFENLETIDANLRVRLGKLTYGSGVSLLQMLEQVQQIFNSDQQSEQREDGVDSGSEASSDYELEIIDTSEDATSQNAKEWKRRLARDLQSVREHPNDAYSGYFFNAPNLYTHVSLSVSRMIETGLVSTLFLDAFGVEIEQWIILIQLFDETYTILKDVRVVISVSHSPSLTKIVDIFQKTRLVNSSITTISSDNELRNFSLSGIAQELFKSVYKPNAVPQSLVALKEFLGNPAARCNMCLKCHPQTGYNSIKPYPCECQLCNFKETQLMCSGEELSLEIKRSEILADFLISITYAAAATGIPACLDPYPTGVGYFSNDLFIGFTKDDDFATGAARIVTLLESLPNVTKLAEIPGKDLIMYLNSIDPLLTPLLKWIFKSNLTLLFELNEPHIRIKELNAFGQFKMVTANPAAERKFNQHLLALPSSTKNKTLYAFHGSPVQNWHSIIRNGLNIKRILNARAYGDGVYHSLEFATSERYARTHAQSKSWKNSILTVVSCVSINEIVNAPEKFVSSRPHIVVPPELVKTRYLIFKFSSATVVSLCVPSVIDRTIEGTSETAAPITPVEFVPLGNYIINNQNPLSIPAQHQFSEFSPFIRQKSDIGLFDLLPEFYEQETAVNVADSLPLPEYSSPHATRVLQREYRRMIRIQNSSGSDETSLCWFVHDLKSSNLYRWRVDLINFDKDLPLYKDMAAKGVDAIQLELRFGADFPSSPPFIRVLFPRFLQFMNGGGGEFDF